MVRLIRESAYAEKYVKIPGIFTRYGPVDNIHEYPISDIIQTYRRDGARIIGDENCRYMTALFIHSVSGYWFRKLIFSDNLAMCQKEAERWLDINSHEVSNDIGVAYYALVCDTETDEILVWDSTDEYHRR